MGQGALRGQKHGGIGAALKLMLRWCWCKELKSHNWSPLDCPIGGLIDERSGEDKDDEKRSEEINERMATF